MSWYKQSQKQLGLFDQPKKPQGLVVHVISYNSYGDLSISINGKPYQYDLPWDPSDIAGKIDAYTRKGWGKQLKRIIDWLDQYKKSLP